MKKIISIILSMVLITVVLTSCNTKENAFANVQTESSYTTIDEILNETTTAYEETAYEETTYEEVENDYDYLTYYWTDSASYVIEDLKSQGYQVLNDYGDLVVLSSDYAGAKILDDYYNIRIWISGDTVTGVEFNIGNVNQDSVTTFDNAYNLLEELYGPCEHYYASTDEMTIDEFYYQYHNGEYRRGFTFGYIWYKSDHTAVGVYAEGHSVVVIKYFEYTPDPVLPDTTYNNDSIL